MICNSIPRLISKKMKAYVHTKTVFISSIIHNSKNVETTQMPINY